MRLRVVSGQTMQVLNLESVSQVVVYTDEHDPCSASHDLPDGTVITAHAAEPDFAEHLKNLGVRPPNRVEVVSAK